MIVRSAVRSVPAARGARVDAWLADEARGLFAVLSGVLGDPPGLDPTVLALEALQAALAPPGRCSAARILLAVQAAAEAVADAARASLAGTDEELSFWGYGATLALAVLEGDGGLLAHLGDCAALRLRGGALAALTVDHTLFARLLAEGKGTAAELEAHPQLRHILLRSFGTGAVGESVQPELQPLLLQTGDRLLLCTPAVSRAPGALAAALALPLADAPAALARGGELTPATALVLHAV